MVSDFLRRHILLVGQIEAGLVLVDHVCYVSNGLIIFNLFLFRFWFRFYKKALGFQVIS